MAGVLLAVDGNSLVHRAFHSRAGTGLASDPVWAVRGLLTQVVAAVERVGADVVVVGFDDPADSVRRRRWPHYKATRADKPGVLISQLLSAAAVLSELGVCVVTPSGLEADDVLCSAARHARESGGRTVLMTSDRDAFALIDDSTRVLRILNGGVEASPLLTAERLHLMLGIRPDQYRDFAALRGDPSDNLPGVAGIGSKTATRLLSALGDAAAVFADVEAGGPKVSALAGRGVLARLAHPEARARWQHNCEVMTMTADLPLHLSLTGGAGRLPLSACATRTVFTEHRLLASLPLALRVLAYQDPPSPDFGGLQREPAGAARPEPGTRVERGFGTPRFGRLPKAPAPVDQLALF